MSTVLVIDAACDLPSGFIDDRNIKLLPIAIRVDDQTYTDVKDAQKLTDFYAQDRLGRNHDAESIPYSSEEIERLFLDELVTEYDFALVQTVSRKRSPIYDNATKASHAILRSYHDVREAAGRDGNFGMRVMNSGTLFCGQGVLAAFTSDMIERGKAKNEILKLADAMRQRIYAYLVAPDVYYIRERARKKGDESVGMLTALVAKSLDIVPILSARGDDTFPVAKGRGFDASVDRLLRYAIRQLEHGLLTPYVVVSIAGDLSGLESHEGFKALQSTAASKGVTVLSCVMGLTGGLNVGPGSICVAFAAEDHEFDG
ncbi:DegV family protein [Saccharospirillum alexandrii]|uniref:DegV family protein n=1 Tax=Saccharospirillum alexandrii TaxID=2448477 RepID=UPI000FDC1BC5|nr:DegV family protein [Saccharospirillum alexandrii]